MLLRIVRRERRWFLFVWCDIILRSPLRRQDVRMIALGPDPSQAASSSCFRSVPGGRLRRIVVCDFHADTPARRERAGKIWGIYGRSLTGDFRERFARAYALQAYYFQLFNRCLSGW